MDTDTNNKTTRPIDAAEMDAQLHLEDLPEDDEMMRHKLRLAAASPSPSSLSTASSGSPLVRGGSSLAGSGSGGNNRRVAPTSIAAAQLQFQQQKQLEFSNKLPASGGKKQQKHQRAGNLTPPPLKSADWSAAAIAINDPLAAANQQSKARPSNEVSGKAARGSLATKSHFSHSTTSNNNESNNNNSSDNNKSFGYNVAKSIAFKAYRFNEFWSVNKMRYLNLACLIMTLICLITILLFSSQGTGTGSSGTGTTTSTAASAKNERLWGATLNLWPNLASKSPGAGSGEQLGEPAGSESLESLSREPLIGQAGGKSPDGDEDDGAETPGKGPAPSSSTRRRLATSAEPSESEQESSAATQTEAATTTTTEQPAATQSSHKRHPLITGSNSLIDPILSLIFQDMELGNLFRSPIGQRTVVTTTSAGSNGTSAGNSSAPQTTTTTTTMQLRPIIRRNKNGATIIVTGSSSLSNSMANDSSLPPPVGALLERLLGPPPSIFRGSPSPLLHPGGHPIFSMMMMRGPQESAPLATITIGGSGDQSKQQGTGSSSRSTPLLQAADSSWSPFRSAHPAGAFMMLPPPPMLRMQHMPPPAGLLSMLMRGQLMDEDEEGASGSSLFPSDLMPSGPLHPVPFARDSEASNKNSSSSQDNISQAASQQQNSTVSVAQPPTSGGNKAASRQQVSAGMRDSEQAAASAAADALFESLMMGAEPQASIMSPFGQIGLPPFGAGSLMMHRHQPNNIYPSSGSGGHPRAKMLVFSSSAPRPSAGSGSQMHPSSSHLPSPFPVPSFGPFHLGPLSPPPQMMFFGPPNQQQQPQSELSPILRSILSNVMSDLAPFQMPEGPMQQQQQPQTGSGASHRSNASSSASDARSPSASAATSLTPSWSIPSGGSGQQQQGGSPQVADPDDEWTGAGDSVERWDSSEPTGAQVGGQNGASTGSRHLRARHRELEQELSEGMMEEEGPFGPLPGGHQHQTMDGYSSEPLVGGSGLRQFIAGKGLINGFFHEQPSPSHQQQPIRWPVKSQSLSRADSSGDFGDTNSDASEQHISHSNNNHQHQSRGLFASFGARGADAHGDGQQPLPAPIGFIGRLLSDLTKERHVESQPSAQSRASHARNLMTTLDDDLDEGDSSDLDELTSGLPAKQQQQSWPRVRVAAARIRMRPLVAEPRSGSSAGSFFLPPAHLSFPAPDHEMMASSRHQQLLAEEPTETGSGELPMALEHHQQQMAPAAAAAEATAHKNRKPEATAKPEPASRQQQPAPQLQPRGMGHHHQPAPTANDNPFTSPSSPLFGFPASSLIKSEAPSNQQQRPSTVIVAVAKSETGSDRSTVSTTTAPSTNQQAAGANRQQRSFAYHSNNELAAPFNNNKQNNPPPQAQARAAQSSAPAASAEQPSARFMGTGSTGSDGSSLHQFGSAAAAPANVIMGRRLDDQPTPFETLTNLKHHEQSHQSFGPSAMHQASQVHPSPANYRTIVV